MVLSWWQHHEHCNLYPLADYNRLQIMTKMFVVGPCFAPLPCGQNQGQRSRSRARKYWNRFTTVTPLHMVRFTSGAEHMFQFRRRLCLLCIALQIFFFFSFSFSFSFSSFSFSFSFSFFFFFSFSFSFSSPSYPSPPPPPPPSPSSSTNSMCKCSSNEILSKFCQYAHLQTSTRGRAIHSVALLDTVVNI